MENPSFILRTLRQARGVQSYQLAVVLGISPSYLSMIERGKRTMPAHLIPRISDILNLSVHEMRYLSEIKQKKEKIPAIQKEIMALVHEFFARLHCGVYEKELVESIATHLSSLKENALPSFLREKYELGGTNQASGRQSPR